MYKLTIPKKQLKNLWRLREYAAKGSIIKQVRKAVSDYIKGQEKRFGCPIADIEEAVERHEKYER